MKNSFSGCYSDYEKAQYQKLQNQYNVTEYVTFTLFDVQDDDISVMYDKGIDDWGNIEIRYGMVKMDINRSKNYFFYPSKDRATQTTKEIVLVPNISKIIEQQKDLI